MGMGHIYRGIALSEAFVAHGASVAFAVNDQALNNWPEGATAAAARRVVSRGEGECEAALDCANTTRLADGSVPDWVLIDHYRLGASEENAVRAQGSRVAVIDDLCRPHNADLLVDCAPGRSVADYGEERGNAARLFGPAYAPLRQDFARFKGMREKQKNDAPNLLIAFGGSDVSAVVKETLRALAPLSRECAISVIIGANLLSEPGLRAAAEASSARVLSGVSDMAALLSRTDLAIGAGGVGALERACLGVPSILVEIAENQADTIAGIVASGAGITLDRHEIPSSLAVLVATLLGDPDRMTQMARAGRALCDGWGAARIADAMLDPITDRFGRILTARPIAPEERDLIHRWQSEPGARDHARNPAAPSVTDHARWFASRLGARDRGTWIVERQGEALGMVRLDPDGFSGEMTAEASLLIAAAHRGEGVGAAALTLAEREARRLWHDRATDRPKRLTAYIKPENTASRATFAKAGYRPGTMPNWYVRDWTE